MGDAALAFVSQLTQTRASLVSWCPVEGRWVGLYAAEAGGTAQEWDQFPQRSKRP